MVGHQLMLGVPGDRPLPEIVRLFQETQAVGLIVFRRNFKSAPAFCTWLSQLEDALGRRLLVSVDHEGGRVIHLQEGVTFFPDNLALGWTANMDYARRQGEIEAAELRRLGIDLNLAPTLDVLTASYSPNIGIRSYGNDAALTARLGTARIQSMQAGGLSACAKHFPGQGQSPLDAHLDLPILPTTKKEFESIHAVPFKAAIAAGVDTVMTSHPVYPHLNNEPEMVPATFSRAIVTGLLREALGFKGVILSDDLEMGALKKLGTVGDSAVRAVAAGHDMVLICSDGEAARDAAKKLTQAYQDQKLSLEELKASCRRIESLMAGRDKRFHEACAKPEPEGESLAQAIAQEGIRRGHAQSGELLSGWFSAEKRTAVIYPKISLLNDRIAVETAMLDDEFFIEKLFQKDGFKAQIKCIALDPSEQEQAGALALAQNAGQTLFFCFDPHLYPASRKLLENLERRIPWLAVVFLRDSFGADLLMRKTPYLYTFGFRTVQIRAAVVLLTGQNSYLNKSFGSKPPLLTTQDSRLTIDE